MKLPAKLVEIRKSIEYIQKTERGNQGAMYVDPAVLIKKIKDKMDETGVLLIPSLHNSSIEKIEDPTKANPNATSFLFKSEMTYTFMDTESTDKIEVPWFVTGKHLQDPAMAGGAALTFFERYFLLKFFQIPTGKDDPEYFKDKTREPEPVVYLNESQISQITDTINSIDGFNTAAFLSWAKIKGIEVMPANDFNKNMSALNAKAKAAKS